MLVTATTKAAAAAVSELLVFLSRTVQNMLLESFGQNRDKTWKNVIKVP